MDILPLRDLIIDDLSNYYVVTQYDGKQVTLANAFMYYSFNRILSHEYVDEINKRYECKVAVGQHFIDVLKNKVYQLQQHEIPGNIYRLEDVKKEYQVITNALYEREITQ